MRLLISILCIALFAGPIEAAESNAAALARWQEINQQVTDAYRRGYYAHGLSLAREAHAYAERELGPEHPDTLTSLNSLAMLYQAQGRYGEAEPLLQEAQQLSVKVLGPEHPDTLRSLNNLAFLYNSQGRYGEAEPLYRKALQLSEKVLGPEHPHTLTSLNNLATLYQAQGRYEEAEPLYQKALQLHEKVLGPEHPNTVGNLHNLAALYEAQGRYGEAEPLYQKALQLHEKALGPEHPNTLTSLDNLAFLYQAQGRYGEAEPLYRKALQLHEKVLGPEHPDTITNRNNLAGLYEAQGRYGEAEPLYRKALQLREKVLGPEHPDTLSSRNNLASLYLAQGRYGEAEPRYQKALQLREKVLGPEHPDTLSSRNNLAALYKAQGRYGEAEPLYQKALRLREKVLGPGHPDTLSTELNLVGLHINQDRTAEALAELQRMEPRLLRRAAALWYTTEEARVRGGLLFSLSNFQDVVLSLAIQRPSAEAAGVAAEVVLRWKQPQTEEEIYLAALVRHSQDPRVRELAVELAGLRARLPVLYRTGKPTTDTVRALDQKELALARLSGPFATKLVLSVIVARRRAEMSGVQAPVKVDGRRLKTAFRMQSIDCFPRDRCVGSEAIAPGPSGGDPCRRISPDRFESTMANSQRASHAAQFTRDMAQAARTATKRAQSLSPISCTSESPHLHQMCRSMSSAGAWAECVNNFETPAVGSLVSNAALSRGPDCVWTARGFRPKAASMWTAGGRQTAPPTSGPH